MTPWRAASVGVRVAEQVDAVTPFKHHARPCGAASSTGFFKIPPIPQYYCVFILWLLANDVAAGRSSSRREVFHGRPVLVITHLRTLCSGEECGTCFMTRKLACSPECCAARAALCGLSTIRVYTHCLAAVFLALCQVVWQPSCRTYR